MLSSENDLVSNPWKSISLPTWKRNSTTSQPSGRGADELLQDALASYIDELAQTRDLLDSRYDELKSGRVKLIDGEDTLARLRAKTEAQRNIQK